MSDLQDSAIQTPKVDLALAGDACLRALNYLRLHEAAGQCTTITVIWQPLNFELVHMNEGYTWYFGNYVGKQHTIDVPMMVFDYEHKLFGQTLTGHAPIQLEVYPLPKRKFAFKRLLDAA